MQDGNPWLFLQPQINAQCNYTTEQELLSIVETLKERNTLLGKRIIATTDHGESINKNLSTVERNLFVQSPCLLLCKYISNPD
jgi:hypothetical protein